MFIPLKDRNPLKIIPFQFVTAVIIGVCTVSFIWQISLDSAQVYALHTAYGLIPAALLGSVIVPPEFAPLPAELTAITSLFLHGSIWHLLGNMLFLWIFGDNVEDSMGHWRFALFYILCGIAAALTHAFVEANSQAPLIGASGAISGILGAYLLMHPRVKILVLVIFPFTLHVPAYLLIGCWIAFDVYNAVAAGESAIAWWAHIGGFVTGALLIIPFRYRDIPLLDKGVEH